MKFCLLLVLLLPFLVLAKIQDVVVTKEAPYIVTVVSDEGEKTERFKGNSLDELYSYYFSLYLPENEEKERHDLRDKLGDSLEESFGEELAFNNSLKTPNFDRLRLENVKRYSEQLFLFEKVEGGFTVKMRDPGDWIFSWVSPETTYLGERLNLRGDRVYTKEELEEHFSQTRLYTILSNGKVIYPQWTHTLPKDLFEQTGIDLRHLWIDGETNTIYFRPNNLDSDPDTIQSYTFQTPLHLAHILQYESLPLKTKQGRLFFDHLLFEAGGYGIVEDIVSDQLPHAQSKKGHTPQLMVEEKADRLILRTANGKLIGPVEGWEKEEIDRLVHQYLQQFTPSPLLEKIKMLTTNGVLPFLKIVSFSTFVTSSYYLFHSWGEKPIQDLFDQMGVTDETLREGLRGLPDGQVLSLCHRLPEDLSSTTTQLATNQQCFTDVLQAMRQDLAGLTESLERVVPSLWAHTLHNFQGNYFGPLIAAFASFYFNGNEDYYFNQAADSTSTFGQAFVLMATSLAIIPICHVLQKSFLQKDVPKDPLQSELLIRFLDSHYRKKHGYAPYLHENVGPEIDSIDSPGKGFLILLRTLSRFL